MILQTRNTLLKPSNTEYKVMQYTGCNFFLIVDRITNNTKCCKHVLLLNCQSANLYKVGSLSLSNIMVHVVMSPVELSTSNLNLNQQYSHLDIQFDAFLLVTMDLPYTV